MSAGPAPAAAPRAPRRPLTCCQLSSDGQVVWRGAGGGGGCSEVLTRVAGRWSQWRPPRIKPSGPASSLTLTLGLLSGSGPWDMSECHTEAGQSAHSLELALVEPSLTGRSRPVRGLRPHSTQAMMPPGSTGPAEPRLQPHSGPRRDQQRSRSTQPGPCCGLRMINHGLLSHRGDFLTFIFNAAGC